MTSSSTTKMATSTLISPLVCVSLASPPAGASLRNETLVSTPVASTRPSTQSVFRSWQPRSSTLSAVSAAGSFPSRCRLPLKSFTLSLGASALTCPPSTPTSSAGSERPCNSDPSALGAMRSLTSVSPSSGFVLTQHWPPAEPWSSNRSAGKGSRLKTRTTSPTATSDQVERYTSAGLPSVTRSTSTGWELATASALWRALSSNAMKTMSRATIRKRGPHWLGTPRVIEMICTICIAPMHAK
mmetsp:Transcript_3508/g.9076  ORF Transcript_3508/g.9076 Transcript_3508/m.9076 type:complete len:242 (-) Transcript_3508:397-1122(-)